MGGIPSFDVLEVTIMGEEGLHMLKKECQNSRGETLLECGGSTEQKTVER